MYIATPAGAESGDCNDIPVSTIATIFISTTIALCIISCVMGALFHRTLSFSCRTAAKKGHTSSPHYYDEVTINTHVQSTPAHPSSSTTAEMEMCANEAYIHVNPIA